MHLISLEGDKFIAVGGGHFGADLFPVIAQLFKADFVEIDGERRFRVAFHDIGPHGVPGYGAEIQMIGGAAQGVGLAAVAVGDAAVVVQIAPVCFHENSSL